MLPIWYSSTTKQRQEILVLYFAPKPEKQDSTASVSDKNASQKSNMLYRKHHIYGDHHYLIPVARDMWAENFPLGSRQVGNNPTISSYFEKTQLMPVSRTNLSLIQKLQSQPFYVEITKKSYILHVLNHGHYCQIPSQRLIPKKWFSPTCDPVITMTTNKDPVHFSNLQEIPWLEIAEKLGSSKNTYINQSFFSK